MDLGLGIELMPLSITPSVALEDDATGGSVRVSRKLPYVVEQQAQTNWCWAAQATSIGHFYGTGSWTQCDTASDQVPGGGCCQDPSACNVYGRMDLALEYTRTFNREDLAPLPASLIAAEIDAGHPVLMRCAWNGDGAHFVAIVGYEHPAGRIEEMWVTLQDSDDFESTMPLASFPARYRTRGGSWTHTFLSEDAG